MSRARDTANQINRVNSSAADATAITVASSENVGIGTSSPASDGKLTIHGTDTDSGILLSRSSGNDVAIHNIGGTLAFRTGGESTTLGGLTERMRIDSSGRVMIGTTTEGQETADNLTIADTGHCGITLRSGASSVGTIFFSDATSGTDEYVGYIQYNHTDNYMKWQTNGAERMRIDSSGNVIMGQTSESNVESSGGHFFHPSGYQRSTRNGSCHILNRLSSDGDIVNFQKNGTNVGFIGTLSDSLYIGTPYSNDSGLRFSAGTIHPCNNDGSPRDNGIYLGYASGRFTVIYAVNGTIQTSDQTEKQDIASLTDTEMLVGKRISALFKNYRWIDKVTVEGDDARTHTGVIAQEVQAAFSAEGLDASNYGLFCSDTWWEHGVAIPAVEAVEAVTETTTDEDGNEVVTVITEAVEAKDAYTRIDHYHVEAEAPEGSTERTRLGIRYPELLSFVAAYNEQRFASIEARLTALEA